jgi:hypothetical protein
LAVPSYLITEVSAPVLARWSWAASMMGLAGLPGRSPGEMGSAGVVRQALLRLRPELRGVLVELFWRRRSVAEAAAALGVPESVVAGRAYEALCCLRGPARGGGR